MRRVVLLVLAVVAGVVAPAQARPADDDAPVVVLREGRLPVGAPPAVPYLRGGHLDPDRRVVDRELVDGTLVLSVPGRAEWVGRLGDGYALVSGSLLVPLSRDGQRRVLASRVRQAFTSYDGRWVGLTERGGRVRVLDDTGAELGSRAVAGADLVGMQGRAAVLRTYTSFPFRGTTTRWDPRTRRLTKLASWPADLVDPTGRTASRWTRGSDGGNCYTVAALRRPGVERFRQCGDNTVVSALGPDMRMLTSPTAEAGLGLRSPGGRLLLQLRHDGTDLESDLVGGPDDGVDARWESAGVVLVAAEALYQGTAGDTVYGIARCTTRQCEWAGEPQPIG